MLFILRVLWCSNNWCKKLLLSMKLSIWKYFSKILLRNFHRFQGFRRSFLMSGPLRAIPSICNQRSLVKESLYARLGYINNAERGKILSHKDKMRSSLLAFFVCISVASSLFFQVSFKHILNTIDIRIKTVLLVPFLLKGVFSKPSEKHVVTPFYCFLS